MTTAVLSLGSNMGEPREYLAAAVTTLRPVLASVSGLYRTPPWGPVPQDDFLNLTAIVTDDATDAGGWWRRAQTLEQAAGRRRESRWGPRTLDVDVIAVWQRPTGTDRPARSGEGPTSEYDDVRVPDTEPVISDDPNLILPHPRAFGRGFVLVPWAEIQPAAVLPNHGPIVDLIAALDVSGIERVGSLGA
ncbi:MAG: 2-amino-4-hydroxy-6-hydroxymethyldihydropteridine diphosphokinase [Actinobacteria bacterium 69-20]|jgi:2-amino-4-hydroxy-6-hydroxymethyldihydropteridine diphosphokinase|nr:2-amino-4-hydroxy-6-hydroxymethyldihydropteridine diphosphokinase [Actinomycetota bacterium]OJV23550.1 MAG: 2-amino-4-hydroxy-6-hydroxymethyldihydropteridine diphosphokinase [Actinobacteria bacterium 69-20]